MRMKTKLPEGLTGIATLMGMEKEEVKAWPHYSEMRALFKDFNMKYETKETLIEKLSTISDKCKGGKLDYFCAGINNAITSIKIRY